MRRHPMLLPLSLALVLATIGATLVLGARGPDDLDAAAPAEAEQAGTEATSSSTTVPTGPLTFSIDDSLRPYVDLVEPIGTLEDPRPVGVYHAAGGSPAELVLDELIVHVADDAELDEFVARWDGEVVDSFAPEPDGSRDHLVRVDATLADPDDLTGDLLAYEPEHAGEHRVSDDRVLQLLAVAASEWARGTEVVIDWLAEPTAIEDGHVHEAGVKNVFDWTYMQATGPMATGVAEAWQLLAQYDRLHKDQTFMLRDGGFEPNPDFPRNAEIKHADWGESNPGHCTGGSDCPWHGTDVILAGIGRVDNDFGVAGPGGPVADSVIAIGNSLDYWTQLRRLERHAEDRHPTVVNLSFGREVNVGKSHARYWTDRRMDHIQDAGALVVAAAGNDGTSVDGDSLIIPCESKNVLCVGGYDTDATRADGSNFGEGDSPTSVEIWGPMCVEVLADPTRPLDLATKRTCGTSVASPFVAGVAMLVKAADPSLRPGEIRAVLNQTAHVGGLGSEVTGSQRRIDALGAVASVLDVDVSDPVVSIDSIESGDRFPVGEWIDLDGSATDFAGRSLELSWSSDLDGHIATGNRTFTEDLSVGVHVVGATATDTTGRTSSASVTIEVVDTPAQIKLVVPYEGFEIWEGGSVSLVADSLDPDSWTPVPDDEIVWHVFSGGTRVFVGSGHEDVVPASALPAGEYRVELLVEGQTLERTFTVEAIPPGEHPPTAHITGPDRGLLVHVYNGKPTPIDFSGFGTDPEDGMLEGTRYRWLATSGDTQVTLCEGSQVPGAEGGGFVQAQDCADYPGELGLVAGDGQSSTWEVSLVVYDSAGLPSNPATITIETQYVTG